MATTEGGAPPPAAGATAGGAAVSSIDDLAKLRGVVIRQRVQKGEFLAQAVGLPIEFANRYNIMKLPDDVKMGRTKAEISWRPSNPELCAMIGDENQNVLLAAEDTDCMMRCLFMCLGCGNERPFDMNFMTPGTNQKAFSMERPFKLGGCCGKCIGMDCCVREISVKGTDGSVVSRAREDWESYCARFLELACCCTARQDIFDENDELKYKMSSHHCCCPGYHNNCCGATCISNDHLIDITDEKGTVVATAQWTYAGGPGMDGCCDSGLLRMCGRFSTIIVEFPEGASPQSKAAIMAAIYQFDYMFWEKKGNDNGE